MLWHENSTNCQRGHSTSSVISLGTWGRSEAEGFIVFLSGLEEEVGHLGVQVNWLIPWGSQCSKVDSSHEVQSCKILTTPHSLFLKQGMSLVCSKTDLSSRGQMPHTAKCCYNRVQYDMKLHTALQWLKHPIPCHHGRTMGCLYRDHFVYASSQWETTLHCNVASHWLGTYTNIVWITADLNSGYLTGVLFSYVRVL